MDWQTVPYSPEWKAAWDAAAGEVRPQSFLFRRDFMDYHADRFEDASLLVLDGRHHVAALLPANVCRTNPQRVESHGGLTYGGLLLPGSTGTAEAGGLWRACLAEYRRRGFRELHYKPVPAIYHTYPAEEDLYWLFRYGAQLSARAVSSAIDLRSPLPLSTLRRRKVHKAEKTGNLRLSADTELLPQYWNILTQVLEQRHQTHPVHTLAEMRLLMQRFPDEIRLFTVKECDGSGENVVAGCILFLTRRVAHVQYIAASDEGCELSALDWLFARIIEKLKPNAADRPWLDFGISTEQGGRVLNEGLIFQKEGFGGRAVCYDAYDLTL